MWLPNGSAPKSAALPVISSDRPLLLASASPARRRLLEQAGIAHWVQVSGVDEDAIRESDPVLLVQALAAAKAGVVRDQLVAVGQLAGVCGVLGCDSVLVFEGAYHGGVLSFPAGAPAKVNVPHVFALAPYNDLEAARAALEPHRGDVAAILVEPMLGSGGCIPGDPAFLHGLRALADAHGALLVFDEVMTSRLSYGGRQSLLGLRPDLTTLGKYFGGGMSIGAFGGRADVIDRFDPRRADALAHAGTFNNNVLTMAAGLAGLQRVLTREALDALNARGERLRARLAEVFTRHGVALQASGLGSLSNLHATDRPIRSSRDLAGLDPRIKDLLFFDLLERGVWMARRGFMALSLPFGDAELDTLVAAFDDVVGARRGLLPAAG